MYFSRSILRLAIPLFLTCSSSSAQIDNKAQSVPQANVVNRDLPKNPTCPTARTVGQVKVSVLLDPNGNVSEAKALSGPVELIPATVECAKGWKYEPPASAPVEKIVSVSYSERDCPGPISERGDIQWSWVLRDKGGKVVANLDGEEPPAPVYPVEERKAGAAGRMVLRVSLNADHYVTDVQVVRSVSASLDKAVMDRLRPLKFTLRPDFDSRTSIADLYFVIVFHAICTFETLSTIESAK